ncbi:hypothetical protein Efla_006505 [Eimeria flavescens]
MAVGRHCCCALTCRWLKSSDSSSSSSSGSSSSSRLSVVSATERGAADCGVHTPEAAGSMHSGGKQQEAAAACECFFAVTHNESSKRFAPLYVHSIDQLFPCLQAALLPAAKDSSNSNSYSSSKSNSESNSSSSSSRMENTEQQQATHWHPYLLAGCLGALELCVGGPPSSAGSLTAASWPSFVQQAKETLSRASLICSVSGDLPLGAGLSSSSALVVAVVTAVTSGLGFAASPKDIAELSARAERYVGVQGGGMDQACICLSLPGFASLTSFNPLAVEHLKLPDNCIMALGYCGSDSRKILESDKKYNLRVLECLLAAILLMRQAFLLLMLVSSSLGHLSSPIFSFFCLQAALRAVESLLHEEPYGKEEFSKMEIHKEIDRLLSELPALGGAWAKNSTFYLKQRARHVFGEALRVCRFSEVCKSNLSAEEKLREIGGIAEASHASCKDDFACSSKQLDAFVSLAKLHGAAGARLTGAVCRCNEEEMKEKKKLKRRKEKEENLKKEAKEKRDSCCQCATGFNIE